jgi:glyoxylase-like metal-dependent hydrolase (beta-lactamase superfamily II)
MRTLQYVAGVVLLALLAVIAYDLHRVANAMVPNGPGRTVGELSDAEFRKFHADYDARLKNQQKLMDHDLDVIFGHGDLESTTKQKSAQKPSR